MIRAALVAAFSVALFAAVRTGPHFDPGDVSPHFDQYTHSDSPPPGGGVTQFEAPLNANGITSLAYAPEGFTAPTFLWLGSDPLNDQLSAQTFTANGDPTESDTPFCPDGDYSDLTAANCMKAIYFDGTGDFYSGGTSFFDMDDDFTMCALVRRDASDTAVSTIYLSKYLDDTTDQGWLMRSLSNGAYSAIIARSGGTPEVSQNTGIKFGEWLLNCVSVDLDGDVNLWTNGYGADNEPVPSGDGTNSENFLIGDGAFSSDVEFQGDIAFVVGWDGTALSQAEAKEYTWFALGLGTTTGHDVASYSTVDGSGSGCWVDGVIDEFGESFPKIGCTSNPLLTENGSSGDMVFQSQITNELTYTRNLSNWVAAGTGTVTCAQGETPFLDGRPTCLVVDDDESGAEYISLTISPTFSTSHRYTLCIAAKSAEPNDVAIDVAVSGATGGACTPWTDNFNAASVDDQKWHVITQATGAADDGDCSDITIDIGPVQAGQSFADDTQTASAYVVPLGFYIGAAAGISVNCPQIFSSETRGATATFGDDDLSYTISDPVVTAGGAWIDGASMLFDVMYHSGDITRSPVLLNINDGSTANYIEVQEIANNTYRLLDDNNANIITSSARTVTTGAVYEIKTTINYTADAYEMFENNASIGTATTSLVSPSGMVTINVGADDTGAVQSEDSLWISDVRVVTP